MTTLANGHHSNASGLHHQRLAAQSGLPGLRIKVTAMDASTWVPRRSEDNT
jgi:hypothetical protein